MSRIFDALQRAAEIGKTAGPADPGDFVKELVNSDLPKGERPADADIPAVAPPPPAKPMYRVEKLRLPAGAPTLPFDGSSSRAAEQYRLIRTRILSDPRQPQVIMVASPTPRDGKTITAVNLAAALALRTENKVLLVDGDLRRPGIASSLGIPSENGLGGVLDGTCQLEDAIVNIAEVPGLYVLPSDRSTLNPSELLDSPVWKTVCTSIRRDFRYIVVDSPPISSVADYELLEQSADGVVIVVRPDHTIRSLAFRVLETVPREKQLGLIVNCAIEWFLFKPPNPYYYGQYR